jgi:hypothetical protein
VRLPSASLLLSRLCDSLRFDERTTLKSRTDQGNGHQRWRFSRLWLSSGVALMRISQAQALCTSTFWQAPFAEHLRSLSNSVPAMR